MRKYLISTAAAAVSALIAMPIQAQNSRVVEEGGSGPYKAIMMEEQSLATHTIFRPQDISKFDSKNLLPVVVWGNGGCANSPSGHINFLNEVASQGYLIVAIGPSNYQQIEAPRPGQTGDVPPMGGGQRPQGAPMGGGMPQMGQGGGFPGGGMPQMGGGMPQMGGGMPPMGGGMPQMGGQRPQGGGAPMGGGSAPMGGGGGMSMGDPTGLKQALEWAIAQNSDKNSPYYQKLDINNIAAAGMSCGGLQALNMSDDARIKTILVMNSGLFNNGGDKSLLKTMKQKSVIWILGGPTDIAYENGSDDFKQLTGTMPAFICNLDGIGHGGTYMQPNGGDYAKVAGAWLNWWLKDNKESSTMFTGNEPGIAKMAGWTFDRKNIK